MEIQQHKSLHDDETNDTFSPSSFDATFFKENQSEPIPRNYSDLNLETIRSLHYLKNVFIKCMYMYTIIKFWHFKAIPIAVNSYITFILDLVQKQ